MTYESNNGRNNASKNSSVSGSQENGAKRPVTRDAKSRLLRRPRLVNSFRHRKSDEPKVGDDVSGSAKEEAGGSGNNHKSKRASNRRRSSCPSEKHMLSPNMLREKHPHAAKSVIDSADFTIDYPTPEIETDIFNPQPKEAPVPEVTIAPTPREERVVVDWQKETSKPTEIQGAIAKEKTSPSKDSQNQEDPQSPSKAGVSKNNPSSPRHWGNTLSGMRTSRRLSVPVTTLERDLETALILAANQPSNEKNEAELIEPGAATRLSFNGAGSTMLKPNGKGGAGSGAPANRKARYAESQDRELASLYKNNVVQRRLQTACLDIDRQSQAGAQEFKNMKQQMTKQHAMLLKVSPSTEDWLSQRKCRTASLQERERESITRRYSRRARHFRAPPELKDTVSGIRTRALLKAGLADGGPEHPGVSRSNSLQNKRPKTTAVGERSSVAAAGGLDPQTHEFPINGLVGLSLHEPVTQVASMNVTGAGEEEEVEEKYATPPPSARLRSRSRHGDPEISGAGKTPRCVTPRGESGHAPLEVPELLPQQRRLSMADIKSVQNILQIGGAKLYKNLPAQSPRAGGWRAAAALARQKSAPGKARLEKNGKHLSHAGENGLSDGDLYDQRQNEKDAAVGEGHDPEQQKITSWSMNLDPVLAATAEWNDDVFSDSDTGSDEGVNGLSPEEDDTCARTV